MGSLPNYTQQLASRDQRIRETKAPRARLAAERPETLDRPFAAMGLDTVELLMDVEREFDVEIPNREAAHLGVLGDLANYVSGVLVLRGEPNDPDAVWRRLARVVEQFGVPPELVTRSANVVTDLGLD